MNRFLLLSAAALVGSAAPTFANDQAKSHSIHFLTNGGASYCDGMSFQKAGKHLAVGLHLNEDCAGTNVQVAGTVDKTEYTLNESQGFSEALAYEIFKPIRNGGIWELWVCIDGSTCFQGNQGIYKTGFPAKRGQQVSTTTKVAEMIAVRKATRELHSR